MSARLSESLTPPGIDEAARAFYTLAEHLVAEEHSPMSHIASIGGTGVRARSDGNQLRRAQLDRYRTVQIQGHVYRWHRWAPRHSKGRSGDIQWEPSSHARGSEPDPELS